MSATVTTSYRPECTACDWQGKRTQDRPFADAQSRHHDRVHHAEPVAALPCDLAVMLAQDPDAKTTDTRRALVGARGVATLNGHPALITGINAYAMVSNADTARWWSWPTVARIVSRDGRFTS